MNKQTLAIIGILAVGSLFSVVYASSTIVSDSGVTTSSITTGPITATTITATTLTLSGSCAGCAEGNFGSYNTVTTNTTMSLGSGDTNIVSLLVNNNGTIDSIGNTWQVVALVNGTVLTKQAGSISTGSALPIAQSMNGKYQITINTAATPFYKLYKNDAFLQNLGVKQSQFLGGATFAVAISPNGKFIAFMGKDSVANDDRLVVLRGS